MARVGIREVAQHAGVSLGTVSHYINHPDRVSQAKQQRIQRAIDELGFVRNNAAWQLRLGTSNTIAYLVPDVSNPFFAKIAEGVEHRAALEGYSVFIASSNRAREREDAYIETFEAHRVRGVLVASHGLVEDRLARLRVRGTPSVLVGQRAVSEAQPSVSVDERLGGELVARHLIESGRRRIAVVGGPRTIYQVRDRYAGAAGVVAAADGATIEYIATTDRTLEAGRWVGDLLGRRDESERPDAVFAVNDLLALGVMRSLIRDHGLRVPEDIAIAGYDDIPFADSALVPLTSVRTPVEEFGSRAVELLLQEFDSPDVGRDHVVLEPRLVVRESSR